MQQQPAAEAVAEVADAATAQKQQQPAATISRSF